MPALVASALLAASLVALPGPASGALPAACDALPGPAGTADEHLQNDAYQGGDAGDRPEEAMTLATFYSWGYVDPPVRRDAGDREDWYLYEAIPGVKVIMTEVNATLYDRQLPDGASAAYPEALRFSIEAWRPGGTAPEHVGVPNERGGANVTFAVDGPGTWLYRVRYAAADAADAAPCGGAPAPDAEPLAENPPRPYGASNYGVYIGCHPYCFHWQIR